MSKMVSGAVRSGWRVTLSIGAKTLLAFLMITAVLTGGFYYFISVKFSAHVREDALNRLNANLQGAWSLFHSRPEQMRYGMLQAASEDATKAAVKRGDREFLRKTLNRYSEVRPYVDLWAIVDAEQRVIARKNGNAGDRLEINGTIGKALASGKPVMSTELVQRDALSREGQGLAPDTEPYGLVQLAVVPVVSGGATVGAFVTGILLNGRSWLPDTVYSYYKVDSSVFMVTSGKDLRSVAATGLPHGIFSPSARLGGEITGEIPKGAGFLGVTGPGANGAFLAMEPVLDIRGTPIGALAVALRSSVVEKSISETKEQILLVAGAGLVICLLLAALIYRDTLRPVRAIRSAMEETAAGNLDVELEIRTKDEFESIGQGFNRMVKSIKIREERLESFNQLSKVLLQGYDPALLVESALLKIVELTRSSIGAIYMYDENTGVLSPETLFGIDEPGLGSLRVREGFADRCFAQQRTLGILDTREAGTVIDGLGGNPAGLVWFCMTYKEKPRGVLFLGSLAPYEEEEVTHIEHLVNQTAIALDNAIIHKELEKLSVTDHLTGFFNRRRFSEALSDAFRSAVRYEYEVGILMVDLDNFKAINDTYGHQQGDSVLAELSRVLKENTRTTDMWARYGGEEFVCLVTHSAPEGVYALAEKLRKIIETHRFPGLEGRQVTISIGICCHPSDGVDDVGDLVRIADENLYSAKRNGRNRVVMSIRPESAERMKLVRS